MVFAATHGTESNIYKDLSGKFPLISRAGNQYIFILHNKDRNFILENAPKNISRSTVVSAYVKTIKTLYRRGFKPSFQIMDNEFS